MTIVMLLNTLVKHVDDSLKTYSYVDEDGKRYPIYVKAGFLKERELLDDMHTYDKYVLIRAVQGKDGIEESTATVKFEFAARDSDVEEGYVAVVNMLEHVKQSILKRAFVGEKKFTYDRNFTWKLDEGEAYPMYFGVLEVTFNLPNMQQEDIYKC